MKRILVFGAGRSAYYTIKYLLDHSLKMQWNISIADAIQENLDAVSHDFQGATTILTDVNDALSRLSLIQKQDIVISMLPAKYHILVARDCVSSGVNLITPSYTSAEMQGLNEDAVSKNITILNEIGLDPGIDHMSSMNIIHRLKENGCIITSYKSYCGGLVSAKNKNDNPWGYKFSWAPANVIRAGQDGGLCLINSLFHYVPYHRLFSELGKINLGTEVFESYYNRNSMHYILLYGLENTQTFLRGTLRYEGFGKKWNALIQAGLTADKIAIENASAMPWENYLKGFNEKGLTTGIEEFTNEDPEIAEALEWLFHDSGNIDLPNATPAENIQMLLEKKWKMNPEDKDRVVMVHEFDYEKKGEQFRLKSWMDLEGEDAKRTAMAKTVGLPLSLAASLIANGKIKTKGVILPTLKEVYNPLLTALEKEGIFFTEEETKI